MKNIIRGKQTKLDEEIDDVIKALSVLEKDSAEYSKIIGHLESLYAAKSHETKSGVNKDTMAIVLGNLLGILIIVGYERCNVITSKALGFVIRGRV